MKSFRIAIREKEGVCGEAINSILVHQSGVLLR